jgi:hypothetical protein
MDASEMKHSECAKHRFARKAAGAVRGHLVTSNQEVPGAVVDMVVHRPIRRQPRAIGRRALDGSEAVSFALDINAPVGASITRLLLSMVMWVEMRSTRYGVSRSQRSSVVIPSGVRMIAFACSKLSTSNIAGLCNPLFVTYARGQIEGVKYPQLTAVLANAVKEQQAEIEALKAANHEMRAEIDALKARLPDPAGSRR